MRAGRAMQPAIAVWLALLLTFLAAGAMVASGDGK